jgi:ABC-type lipoprotein export system ATPase subunit
MTTDDPSLLELHQGQVTLGHDGAGGRVRARLPDITLRRGERLVLTGPSGCGKTTLLNCIAGLLPLDHGRLTLCEQDLYQLSPAARDLLRGSRLGIIHQTFHLLHGFTVLDNVLAGLRFGRSVPPGERKARALELLEKVGLTHRLRAQPRRLSVGERQRVAIARALAGHPRLLLADEPTGSLDPASAARAIELMERLCGEIGCAWLCVTHDERLADRFPQRISCDGMIAAGPGEAS